MEMIQDKGKNLTGPDRQVVDMSFATSHGNIFSPSSKCVPLLLAKNRDPYQLMWMQQLQICN